MKAPIFNGSFPSDLRSVSDLSLLANPLELSFWLQNSRDFKYRDLNNYRYYFGGSLL